MDWPELKRRLQKEGTSVQVLADLEGVPYKTMYNRIMAHQQKEGVTYLTPENTKSGPKKTAKRPDVVNAPEEKQDIPEEVYTRRSVSDLPEDISNSTIMEVLMDIKRSHAEAVQTMHEAESMLEQARTSERQLRTILIAVQRLADAETVQDLPEVMDL